MSVEHRRLHVTGIYGEGNSSGTFSNLDPYRERPRQFDCSRKMVGQLLFSDKRVEHYL